MFANLGAVALTVTAALVFGPLTGRAAEGLPSGPVGSPAALEDALAQLDKSPGTVVAEVNGKPVTSAEIVAEIRNLPRVNADATLPAIFRAAANQVISRKALVGLAEAAGLPANPVIRRRINDAEEGVLGDELIHRSLAPNLLEPAVKSTYDSTEVSKAGVTEVRLRLIAVDTRAQAEELLQKIRDGGDFAAFARESSRDPSGVNGGLLDYHWRDTLSPELAAVGFSLAVGDMTAYPVSSGGLWYVVRCEGRGTRPPLTFIEARPLVEREIVTTGSVELRRLAIKQTNISYYGLIGKSAQAATPK